MALDTATKRRSMFAMGLVALVVQPIPDGTIADVDQRHFLGLSAARAAQAGLATDFLHIFSTGVVEPNRISDSGNNVLTAGQTEAQGGAFVGGAVNYFETDSAGISKSNGTAKSLNLQWDTEVFTSDDALDDENVITLVDASSNAVTITLPTAVGIQNRVYYIKAIVGGNAITVSPDGSETIDNDTSWSLASGESITIVSDNANWWII
jgi:hypothetical protein